MGRSGVFGSWLARATLLGLLGLFPAGVLAANADAPQSSGPTVRDAVWAQVLGQTLFWDTVQALSPSETDSGTSPTDIEQVTQILLARHSLERYRWLIERAFDGSLWQGPDDSRLQANFALIWRLSTHLYEATLPARPASLRVCRPGDTLEEFQCHEEADPVELIPIPADGPPLVPLHTPAIG